MHQATIVFTVLLAVTAPALAQVEAWQQIATAHAITPGFRGDTGMAFDPVHGQMVLFGGEGNNGPLNDTWTYDGVDWQQRTPAHVPLARYQHCLAWNPARQRVLMYGGQGSSLQGARTDTWEWDGTDWLQVGSGGDMCVNGAMAFDPVRQQVLRFGGSTAGETRAWTGSQWLLLTTGGPAPRDQVSMACDSLRNRVVLYGGYGPTGFNGRFRDTWEWDGSVWSQRITVFQPPYLENHAMTFDADKGWVLMTAGDMLQGSNLNANYDLYAFDGSNWMLRTTAVQPTTSQLRAGFAFDSVRHRTVYVPDGTWEYTAPPQTPGSFQTFGSGCAGSAGVPALGVSVGELPYIGYPLHVAVQNLGSFVLPFGVLGFSNTSWSGMPLPLDLGTFGFPGCTAYTEVALYDALAARNHVAAWNLQVPNQQAFVGASFYLQAFVFDVAAPNGAIVSNAAAGVIGRR